MANHFNHCTKTTKDKLMFFENGKRIKESLYRAKYPDHDDSMCLTKQERKQKLRESIRNTSDIKTELKDCKDRLGRCNQRVTELEAELVARNNEFIARQNKLRIELSAEIDQLREDLRAGRDCTEELRQLREKMNEELRECKENLNSISNDLEKVQAERNRLGDELDGARQRGGDCDKRLSQITEERNSLEERNKNHASLKNLLDTCTNAKDLLTDEKIQLTAELRRVTQIIENLNENDNKANRELTERSETLRAEILSLQNEIRAKESERKQLETHLESAAEGYNELSQRTNQERDTNRSSIESLSTQLKSMQKNAAECELRYRTLQDTCNNCNRNLEESTLAQQELRQQIQALRADLAKKEVSVADARQIKDQLSELQKLSESKVARFNEDLLAKDAKNTEEINRLTAEYTAKNAEMGATYQKIVQERDAILAELNDLKEELSESRAQKQISENSPALQSSANNDQMNLQSRISELERQVKSNEISSTEASNTIGSLRELNTTVMKRMQVLQNEHSSLSEKHKICQTEKDEFDRIVQGLKQENSSLSDEKETLLKKSAMIENQFNALRLRCESGESHSDEIRKSAEEGQRVQRELRKQIQSLQEDNTAKMADLIENSKKSLENLQQQHSASLKGQEERYNVLKEENETIRLNFNKRVKMLQDQHRDEIRNTIRETEERVVRIGKEAISEQLGDFSKRSALAIDNMRENYESLTKEKENLQGMFDSLSEKYNNGDLTNKDLSEKLASVQTEITSTKSTLSELQESNNNFRLESEQHVNETRELQSRLASQQEECTSTTTRLSSELQQVQQELEAERAKNLDLTNKNRALTVIDCPAKVEELKKTRRENESLKELITEYKPKFSALTKEKNDLEQKLLELQGRFDAANTDFSKRQAECSGNAEKLDRLEAEMQRKEREMNEEKTRLETELSRLIEEKTRSPSPVSVQQPVFVQQPENDEFFEPSSVPTPVVSPTKAEKAAQKILLKKSQSSTPSKSKVKNIVDNSDLQHEYDTLDSKLTDLQKGVRSSLADATKKYNDYKKAYDLYNDNKNSRSKQRLENLMQTESTKGDSGKTELTRLNEENNTALKDISDKKDIFVLANKKYLDAVASLNTVVKRMTQISPAIQQTSGNILSPTDFKMLSFGRKKTKRHTKTKKSKKAKKTKKTKRHTKKRSSRK
jgi:chromosome segregation ATPase